MRIHLIGKETERGWEQSEDVSTLLPSLMGYVATSIAVDQFRHRLLKIPLATLEREMRLSRHRIVRLRGKVGTSANLGNADSNRARSQDTCDG